MITAFGRIGLLNRLRQYERRSGNWSMAAAFIAGMALTAALAQIYIFQGNAYLIEKHEPGFPAPLVASGPKCVSAGELPGELKFLTA